ncbi:MAG: hypothetical protein R6V61_02305 [Wenzhouxiangellaceae bacterium]
MHGKPVELRASIRISGDQEPFQVDVPVVRNKRERRGVPRPATIIYTLEKESIDAGFTLGDVDLKTESPDIDFVRGTDRKYIFSNTNTVAEERYLFGFHYHRDGKRHYFDPEILNEEFN